MTSETPCLSGCWVICDYMEDGETCVHRPGQHYVDHAPNCPNAPKPAEPQGIEGSEPPIDWEAAEGNARWWVANLPKVDLSHKLARAYLALKSERDALKLALAEEDGYLRLANAKNAALKARVEALTAAADRVVKRRNRHYKDVRDSVDTLEAVLAKYPCSPKCGSYEHVVEDQHANGCPVLRKEQEASNGK